MYINTTQALLIAEKEGMVISLPTLILWCKEAGLAHQVPKKSWGRWIIHKEDFIKFLKEGKNEKNKRS